MRDERVDAYIQKSAEFAQPILRELREIVHQACPQAEESIKWGHPAFLYQGMLCGMAAFKQHCAFGFWKGKLVLDKKTNKPAEAMGNFGRITSMKDLPPRRILITYIKTAMRLNAEGVRLPGREPRKAEKKELVIPGYFEAALTKNKKAQAAFAGLPYSHKKEYLDWITDAKRDETRTRRIQTAIEWLAEGKSRNWKYEKR